MAPDEARLACEDGLTVKVDFVTAVDVADSTTEDTEDAASEAASFAWSTTSARTTAAARAAVAKVVKRILDDSHLFATNAPITSGKE